MKKAKIVATLGPASNTLSRIKSLVKAGLDVCRLNSSFGTEMEHQKTIDSIRQASKQTGKSIAILQDLQGPKIRVGNLDQSITVKKGNLLTLSGNSIQKNKFYIPTTYKQIAADTKPGKTILMADGKIILGVQETNKSKKEVLCKVINGGTILTGKGINLPYTDISLPALTDKDKKDALFGIRAGVDFIGLSFVRQAEDVLKLRRLIKKEKANIPIIAKIEKPEALDNLDEILDVVDGVMVARGDLAVEISFAKVPLAQKEILCKANRKGKITIVATEMLSSMVDNPRPTRAEASDVANAVLDGTDAVMLSNETSIGKYPLKSVKAMSDIVLEAEKFLHDEHFNINLELPEIHALTEALCSSASYLSYYLNERALVVITHSGSSVHILSKFRPESTIYAATFNEYVYQKMALYHNVYPILLDTKAYSAKDVNEFSFNKLEKLLISRKLVSSGNSLIFLTGKLGHKGWNVDTISVKTVGQ